MSFGELIVAIESNDSVVCVGLPCILHLTRYLCRRQAGWDVFHFIPAAHYAELGN